MSANPTSISNPFESAGDFTAQVQSLDSSRLAELDAWADGLARHAQGGEWRKRGEKLVAEGKAGPVAEYAYAALLAAQGERAESARLLVDLAEKASGAHAWSTVVAVARKALALDAGAPAARWLVKAIDETGDDEARFLALVEAHEGAPAEARLAWRLSRLYESRGLHAAALEATQDSLEALARKHDAAGMEEVLLFMLENPQADYLRLTLPPLPLFAKGGEAARVASFLELAWPALKSTGLAPETWKTVRSLLLEVPQAEVVNPLVPGIATSALPHLADVTALLDEAGFGKEPAAEWIPRFEKLLPFAPGAFAEHSTMGAGRVTSLTRDEVWIDFPAKPGHRMSLRAAHQALIPVDAEDLAVLASWHRERMAELRTKDPVDLVVRALRRLRGQAATADLKKVLVRYAVPEKEWTAFWNAAKNKLAKDPRIDASHAFQQRYAIGTGTVSSAARETAVESPTAVPRFDRGSGAKKVLATLKKFLAQHPGQAAQLVRERGGVLRAWRDDSELDWRERISALLILLAGADGEAAESAPSVVAAAFRYGFELRELTTAAEQAQVLDLGLVSSAWERAARSGIGSRFGEVRDRAFREVMERHGEQATPFFENVARKMPDAPEAAIAILERAWKSKGGEADPVTAAIRAMDPWEAASGLAEFLEAGSAEPARAKAAVALLDPKGGLARAARSRPAPEDARRRIERLFMHWRASDRGLLPFVEWAETAGLEDVGAAVREKRHLALRKITTFTDTTPIQDLPRTFLTRQTFDKLKREAEALDAALRGEIPQAIQKARELGDLRENAEYESAKLKQRTFTARLALLIEKMRDVSFIEDVPFVADTVGLGTEVEIALGGDGTRRLWILGEGDDHLGPDVVSYKAPLGRALVGKKRGDPVSLPSEGGERSGVIESVRPRLPETTA
ncbi:MAG TPA: GreA/GreB family elongation factor [Candidatus Eisenbacteria bacterium]|nr:GreA/GreB family elongation factor [Candidatus Eisenbacteria bacterium]